MRKYRWMICLLTLLFLFLSGCGKEEGETVPEQLGEKQQEETGQGEAPVLTEIPISVSKMHIRNLLKILHFKADTNSVSAPFMLKTGSDKTRKAHMLY